MPSNFKLMKTIKKFHVSKIQVLANNTIKTTTNTPQVKTVSDSNNIRIRPSTPKVNLLRNKMKSQESTICSSQDSLHGVKPQDIDELIENALMNPNSDDDPIRSILAQYLSITEEELSQLSKIAFTVDTTKHNLQFIGETLPLLVELKLSLSKISSIRDIGTSFRELRILWINRVGLNDLSGII